jgi:lysozyme
MAKISKDGLDLIKEFESFVGYVYDDLVPPVRGKYPEWKGQKPKGTLTIGYGHTNAAKDPLKCTLGTKVTMAQALTILSVDLGPCEDIANKLVKVPITQHQFDALVSFSFNTGKLANTGLLKKLNDKNYAAVPAEFMKWTKSKGKELKGLVRRRKAEVALWSKPDHAHPPAQMA